MGVVVMNSFVKQRQLTVTYSTTSLVDSRQKEIQIHVADFDNVSLSNATVQCEQTSQGLLYNVGEYSEPGSKEAGSNTEGIYLDWWWGKLEPNDDEYNWSYLEVTGILDANGSLRTDTTHAEHIFLRLGVIATSAWVVGEHMDSFQETGYPAWINKSNLPQVKTKYLEFVSALLHHLRFKPDFYMIEVEIDVLGINAGLTNTEIVDWLDKLTTTIKEVDASANISITVSSHDLSPFMNERKAGNDVLVEQDRYPLNTTEFLERMSTVDYDIITVFVQPFGWTSKGNWTDAARFFDSLCAFNKSVYIAWVSFLAEEPQVPEVLNPQPNGVNTTGFIYYPNPGGHSEEWQQEQTLRLMQYVLSNPKIRGVHWDMIDYTEISVGGQDIEVRLATGFTSGYRDTKTNEVIEGEKRQVYTPMSELWWGLFSNGSLKTDKTGMATFIGLPGTYHVIISHLNYETKELVIEV